MTIAALFGENPITLLDEQIWKDVFTGALVQIEISHEAIHLGRYFQHSNVVSVANGANSDWLLITPDISIGGPYVHLRLFQFDASGAPISFKLYEDTTTSANGTAQSTYNFNRNYTDGVLGVYLTPTIITLGTQLVSGQISGTKQAGGSGQTSGTEWVLKSNTKYLIRLTNSSGSVASIGFNLEWYELPSEN